MQETESEAIGLRDPVRGRHVFLKRAVITAQRVMVLEDDPLADDLLDRLLDDVFDRRIAREVQS